MSVALLLQTMFFRKRPADRVPSLRRDGMTIDCG